MKNILLSIALITSTTLLAQWNQVGNDIGSAVRNFKMNGDGSEIAIGNQFDATYGTDRGLVQIMQWNGSAWVQKGNDIYGANDGDKITVLDLSDDGDLVLTASVMGYYATMYAWNGFTWDVKGTSINLSWPFCLAGSISNNGAAFAVGSEYADNTPVNDVGSAKVFEWDGVNWTQKGSTFTGTGLGGHLGSSVSLSADGDRLAIGEDYDNSGNTGVGKVRIYDWNGVSWTQVGSILQGSGPYRFGKVADLSADGSSVAISEPRFYDNGSYKGQVLLYEWNGSDWAQKGNTIDNNFAGAEDFGEDIDFTNDGLHLVVGVQNSQSNIGAMVVYYWNGTIWEQRGMSIIGLANYEWFGQKVAISNDASYVAGQTYGPGEVRVFLAEDAGIEANVTSLQKTLVKITDLLGRETEFKPNTPLIYIYSDGTTERKMELEE